MERLVDEIAQATTNKRTILHLVALVVGNNRQEALPLFEIGMSSRVGGHTPTVYDAPPSLNDFDMDDPRVMLFKQGDDIDRAVQQRLLHRQSNTYVFAAVSTGAVPLAQQRRWDELFARAATTLVIPPWQSRKPDHQEIVRCMHSRLRMPAGNAVPELGSSALDYLLTKPFVGTDDVNTEIKRGLQAYINTKQTGPLTSEHFAGTQTRRAMEGRGDVRRVPSEPPQAS